MSDGPSIRLVRWNSPATEMMRSLVLERLDQRPAHRRLGRPQRSDEGCRQDHGDEKHERRRWKVVIETHAGDVSPGNLEDVEEVQCAQPAAQDQAERTNGERFNPNRSTNLCV